MLGQGSYGFNSKDGLIQLVRNPVEYVDLENLVRGPVYLKGYGVVDRDLRTDGHIWVPWDLAHETDRWTLMTSLNANTFNPSSLPPGWSIIHVGGGAVTVSGGEILITSAPGGRELLCYTASGMQPTDWQIWIFRGYAKSVTSGSNNNYVSTYMSMDTAMDKFVSWILIFGANPISCFGGLSNTYGFDAIDSVSSIEMRLNPNTGAGAVSGVRVQSDPSENVYNTTNQTIWAGPTGSDFFMFRAESAAGVGPENSVFALEYVAGYRGNF